MVSEPRELQVGATKRGDGTAFWSINTRTVPNFAVMQDVCKEVLVSALVCCVHRLGGASSE